MVRVSKDWKESGMNACPFCGAAKIYDSKPIYNNDGAGTVEIKWSCGNCKEIWFESYTLVGLRMPGQVGIIPIEEIS